MKILIALLFLLSSINAYSQGQGRRGGGNGLRCGQEVREICGQYRGNPEQMQACIAQNRSQFSEQCQQRVGQGRQQGQCQGQGQGQGRGQGQGQGQRFNQ